MYPSRNVDGKKTEFSPEGKQCTTTAENQAFAMWWMDLQNIRRIESIRVYARRDDKKWGKFFLLTAQLLFVQKAVNKNLFKVITIMTNDNIIFR